MDELVTDLTLKDAARQKYLNYAISVITSRALPDVRDGLKPVQRRILYAMFQDLRLLPDKKELKCAKVVGEVLGNYHPHGDSAVYDALVRMAQEFSLRNPLVDGHGNFGSIDGDSAAAYRYTEAKLQPFALTLLEEINQETVDFRDTFDGVRQEPIVLPSQSPMLLVNGATGIAVGIATNIPPHNLGEIIGSCITLINNPDATIVELMKKGQGIQAPDFPTGGLILNTKKELREIYEKGSGPIRMRGEWKLEQKGKTQQIVITSIPYMIKKQELAAKIRDLALDKKVPQITDVRDESTTDIRVVLELRADAEPEKVMAYLFKSTPLEQNFNINMTCLVPVEGKEVGTPRQLDLKSMLRYFLDFRFTTVKRRFEYELRILRERIHILDGFAKIFNDLDTAIKLIRKSKDKSEASEKLIEHFGLDDIQTNAILEMMLYRIASLEINKILEERKEKRARAKEIEEILSSDRKLWSIIKKELEALAEKHQTKRRSKIEALDEADVIEVSAEDFIVEEDQFVILTTGGWVKRIGTIKSLDKLQLRQGDEVLSVVAGSTKSCVVFFSSAGVAYTMRIYDLPASRGYGDPIQKLFKFRDGEKVVGMMSLDPRVTSNFESTKPDVPPKVHLLAVSNAGFGLRFSLAPFVEPSTRAGRKYARVDENAEIIAVHKVGGKESLVVVTKEARALVTKVNEINFLEGAGKGVTVIKLVYPDQVLGAAVCVDEKSEGLIAITQQGAEHKINANKYEVVGRGGRGFEVIKRGSITGVKPPAVVLPELPEKS